MRIATLLLLCLSMTAAVAVAGDGSSLVEEALVVFPEAPPPFASDVAMSDDGGVAVLGAVGHGCPGGTFCGAAYVMERRGRTWHLQEKLLAPEPYHFDEFGDSVAISGDGATVLIGALEDNCPGEPQNCGAAYLFERGPRGFAEPVALRGFDALPGEIFAFSVALSADGRVAAVGDPGHRCERDSFCGAVNIWERQGDGWVSLDTLQASDGGFAHAFGVSVSLSGDGDTVLVGADSAPCGTQDGCGAAYIFRRQGDRWFEEAKLEGSAAGTGAEFGFSVALSHDATTALIGSFTEGCGSEPSHCGAAYVFVETGGSWSEQIRFGPPPADPLTEFELGVSVDLSADGNRALLGANCPFVDVGDAPCNKEAFLYERAGGQWLELQRLTPSNGDPGGRFGYGVALAGDGQSAAVGTDQAGYLYGTAGPGEVGCVDSATAMCLNQGRFQVEVSWRDFQDRTGVGRVVPGHSDDSGLFYFFHPDNWEVLVKVLDGCDQNHHFWVFSAAVTNVEYTLRVRDTASGEVREYFNPLGRAAPAEIDTRAFATCPDA